MSKSEYEQDSLYDGLECGMCNEPLINGEVWCANEDCILSFDGPEGDDE